LPFEILKFAIQRPQFSFASFLSGNLLSARLQKPWLFSAAPYLRFSGVLPTWRLSSGWQKNSAKILFSASGSSGRRELPKTASTIMLVTPARGLAR
jgi:hypothetical protein